MTIWLILIFIILLIFIRVRLRGYFWKDKKGEKLSFNQFMKRWKGGVEGITPLQQTKTTLWSFVPVLAGVIWGITVTLIAKTYWMSLILAGSLPITLVQLVSNYQKYTRLKIVDKAQKEAEKKRK